MSICQFCGVEKEWGTVSKTEYKTVFGYVCNNKECVPTEPVDVCGIMFDKPKESSKWEKFSYRAGYLKEQAQADRRNAESKSHMGKNPYPNIRDKS